MSSIKKNGTVSAIFLSHEKGSDRVELAEGLFLADHGLSGDAYSGPGERQVPLYCAAGRDRLAAGAGDGLCFARFLETLRVDGIDTMELETGDLLSGGTAVLEISPVRKRCFPECPIVGRGERCDLARSVRFCRVVKEGVLRPGQELTLTSG